MALLRKTSPRRDQVRRNIGAERSLWCSRWADADVIVSLLLWLMFVALSIGVLSFGLTQQGRYRALAASSAIVIFAAVGGGLYVCHYQSRLLHNHAKAFALVVMLPALLAVTKLGSLSSGNALWGLGWGVGTAIFTAIILVIAYDQRFAIGMSALYCILASLAVGPKPDQAFQLQGMRLFLTMISGAAVCCFTLKEIRTRMKLLEVSATGGGGGLPDGLIGALFEFFGRAAELDNRPSGRRILCLCGLPRGTADSESAAAD